MRVNVSQTTQQRVEVMRSGDPLLTFQQKGRSMFWNRQAFVFAALAFSFVLGWSVPGYAQPKPTSVNATIVNGTANPVPVLIQEQAAETRISFREGYQVPAGKRLLIDDVSVACTTIGTTLTDFRTFGLSVSTLLHITYPPANCPEPLDSEGECHQLYSVGTAKQNGIEPIFLMPDGRPAARMWAGRQFSVFADQNARVFGQCDGVQVNFPPPSFNLRGTGRLIDLPQ